MWAPLPFTDVDPLPLRPRVERDLAQLFFAEVEAAEVVRKLAELEVIHALRLANHVPRRATAQPTLDDGR